MLTHLSVGLRYMLLSALGFALMAVCVKWSSQRGIPVLEIVAARALVSLLLSLYSVRRRKVAMWGTRKDLLIARGSVGALALICVYYALTVIPLAEATVLQYLHPMFTAVLALLFLKESVRSATLVCIVLSFVGLLLIARPAFLFAGAAADLSGFALLAAVAGAFGSAVAYVLVRKLNETEDPAVIILYFPLIALPLSLVLLGDDFVMPRGVEWLALLLVGIFTQVGQIGLTRSMQTETASRATALSYTQVVFAAVLGWAIFAEVPDSWTIAGASFILLGALINIRYGAATKVRPR